MLRTPVSTPRLLIAASLFAMGLVATTWAEPMDLVTDRPDQTESSVTVAPGYVQIEAGWTMSGNGDGADDVSTHEIPGTLVRIGLTDRVEARIGWAGYVSEELEAGSSSSTTSGLGDGELGAKLYLMEEGHSLPELALLAGVTVPAGADEVTSHEWDPAFRFCASKGISDQLGAGANLGLTWENGREDLYITYTVVAGYAVSDQIGAFAEVYGDVATDGDLDSSHLVDGGVTYLVQDNLQLDLAAGLGLSEAAGDWFLGLGVSYRLPR